jgi:hypothetical protein
MNSSILVYRKVQPRSHQAPFPLSTHSLVVLPGRLLCLLLFWYTKASSRVQAPGEHTNFCRRSLSHVRPRARDLRAPACPSARQAASGVGSVLYEQHASALGQDAAAQEPTHGSTKQGSAPACRWVVAVFVGAVAGTAQLPQQCACVGVGAVPVGRSCRPPARSCRPAGRTPPARTPLCSTTQTTTGRTAVHDGRARRWAVGSAAGVGCVWSVGPSRGRPTVAVGSSQRARERRAAERAH